MPRRLPVALDFLPSAVVDVVVGHQSSRDDRSLNAAGAAVVDVIASYQMTARRLLQLVAVFIL